MSTASQNRLAEYQVSRITFDIDGLLRTGRFI
jgi:hypothetical protein